MNQTIVASLADIDVRPFASLGSADHGWLNAHHHFSFANYYDQGRMGWGSIRVWNDDIIQPQSGFPPHGHQDMEIITYVRTGAITHQDSLGNKGRTEAGDVQVMSAGSGVQHSEYNLEEEATSIFQIWITPEQRGSPPSWGAKPFPKGERAGSLQILASGFTEDDGALPIRTPARVMGATLGSGDSISYEVAPGRHAYLVAATGALNINGQTAQARDGVAIRNGGIVITALEDCEFILVDAA